jgi:SAM-dependent methyltransferase
MYTRPTIDFYDTSAARYFDEWKDNMLLLPLLQTLMKSVPESPKVLDVGCGPGCESKRLSELGAVVVGVDLSEVSLEIARTHAPEVTFLRMDVTQLDFEPSSFHAVLDAACLFHFSDGEQDRIVERLHSLLISGGGFLSVYPTGDFRGIQEREIAGKALKRYVNLKSVDAWSQLVCSHGFSTEQLEHPLLGDFRATLFTRQA